MHFLDISLTLDDFRNANWEQVIADAALPVCDRYYGPFGDAANAAETEGDPKRQEVFTLLHAISSFGLDLDSPEQPFIPHYQWWEGNVLTRGVIPDDLPTRHLDTLAEVVTEITDPALKARIGDVLWVTKRDYLSAQVAVEAYLELVSELEARSELLRSIREVERAAQLAASLGKDSEHYRQVMQFIEDYIDRQLTESVLVSHLMRILQSRKWGNPSKYSAMAETTARQAELEGKPIVAENLWTLKARWDEINGDEEAQRASIIELAELRVRAAHRELELTPPNHAAAQWHIASAIKALRQIPDTKERRDELHSLMLEYQNLAVQQMTPVTSSFDLTEMANESMSLVQGKDLMDAIFTLATGDEGVTIKTLRELVDMMMQENQLLFALSAVTLDDRGRVTDRRPSVLTEDENQIEAVKKAEMLRLATLLQELQASAFVLPALHQIHTEHDIRESDALRIARHSPFVPADREVIFARGLYAGFQGDFLVAAHLLIPQIENSIRHVLNLAGTITSTLDSTFIQQELDLNTMLYSPYKESLLEIFGEDIVFDLEGLLVSKFGSNLRNLLAHGLLSSDHFASRRFVYLWWLVLRLCCQPILAIARNNENARNQDGPETQVEESPTNGP